MSRAVVRPAEPSGRTRLWDVRSPVKVQLLGSSVGDGAPLQYTTSFVVDDIVAFDAGSLGLTTPLELQRRVAHVFLSHSHIDHIGSLPLFIENAWQPGPDCPTVYGNDAVLDCLREDIFNDRVWPDMLRISTDDEQFLRLERLESGRPVRAGHLTITPVAVHHIVPTLAFVVDDGRAAVAFISDTGPTDAIWEVANGMPHLKGVFLEASFPNAMEWLAQQAAHLTPALFLHEYRKLRHSVPVYAIHIKAAFHEQMLGELEALGLPNVQIATPQRIYEF